MWTEHTPTPADVDRQVWPRLCALAEVGWTPKELRNGPDFLARMESHVVRLNQLGVKVKIRTFPAETENKNSHFTFTHRERNST